MSEEQWKEYCHKAFPSEHIEERESPFARIQWKGTNVCMDIHCLCGCSLHLDDEFTYHIKCGKCEQVYECDPYIKLHPLDFEPENTIYVEYDPKDDLYGP